MDSDGNSEPINNKDLDTGSPDNLPKARDARIPELKNKNNLSGHSSSVNNSCCRDLNDSSFKEILIERTGKQIYRFFPPGTIRGNFFHYLVKYPVQKSYNTVKDISRRKIYENSKKLFDNEWSVKFSSYQLNFKYNNESERFHILPSKNELPGFSGHDKKIIYVVHDAKLAGAEILALKSIQWLKEYYGFEVCVLLKSGGLLERKFKLFSEVYNLERDYQDPKKFARLLENFQNRGIKYAICNTAVTGDILKPLTEHKIKCIWLIHELPYVIRKLCNEDALINEVNFAHKLIFASEYVKDKFLEITHANENRCLIIPQAIYMNNKFKSDKKIAKKIVTDIFSLPENSTIILGVGSGDLRKGTDIFTEIAQQICAGYHATYFIWIGEVNGGLIDTILSKKNWNQFKNSIFFVGSDKIDDYELGLFYSASDIFLLPSREDPYPSVILEAMDAGLPVIAFENAGGFADLITKDTGFLVPYLDVDKMREKVEYLLRNKDTSRELGERGSLVISKRENFGEYIGKLLVTLEND